MSRLVRVEKNITYIPGQSYAVPYPYYNSLYGYYPVAYRQVYSPDYLREDHTVRIETNLYAHSDVGGRIRLDGHQRLVQSELGEEGNRRCGQSGGEGSGERGDFLNNLVVVLRIPYKQKKLGWGTRQRGSYPRVMELKNGGGSSAHEYHTSADHVLGCKYSQ